MYAIETLVAVYRQALMGTVDTKAHEAKGAFKYIPWDSDRFIRCIHRASDLLRSGGYHNVSFIDVGCGMGEKSIMASNYFQKCYGIEMNRIYVQKGLKLIAAGEGLKDSMSARPLPKDRVKLILGDARKHDYNRYDCVYFYQPMLDQAKQQVLEDRILSTMKVGAVLIHALKITPPEQMKKQGFLGIDRDISVKVR